MTAPVEGVGEEAARESSVWWSWLAFDERGTAGAARLFLVVGATTSPYFLTIDNLTDIMQSPTFFGFLAIGVGLALMAGEIAYRSGPFSAWPPSSPRCCYIVATRWLAIAGGLGTEIGCGFVNGPVAELIRVPAVVVTLATLGVYRALALVLAGGSPVRGMPSLPGFFDAFGQGTVGGVSRRPVCGRHRLYRLQPGRLSQLCRAFASPAGGSNILDRAPRASPDCRDARLCR
jgi:ribose/xylose/arabinose/galactoside ABC-type transport system permease subunit